MAKICWQNNLSVLWKIFYRNISFVRVHRSFMVSLDKISGYNGLSVQLSELEIPIGRLYKQSVMEKLQPE
jgi:DNA-binding LytR/AlgR family response regulator